MHDGDRRAYYAFIWQANQALGEELRAQAQAGRERIKALREELHALERDIPLAEAAAGQLLHRGHLPRAVVDARKLTPEKVEAVRLRVISQTRPTAAELDDREVAYRTEGAA